MYTLLAVLAINLTHAFEMRRWRKFSGLVKYVFQVSRSLETGPNKFQTSHEKLHKHNLLLKKVATSYKYHIFFQIPKNTTISPKANQTHETTFEGSTRDNGTRARPTAMGLDMLRMRTSQCAEWGRWRVLPAVLACSGSMLY